MSTTNMMFSRFIQSIRRFLKRVVQHSIEDHGFDNDKLVLEQPRAAQKSYSFRSKLLPDPLHAKSSSGDRDFSGAFHRAPVAPPSSRRWSQGEADDANDPRPDPTGSKTSEKGDLLDIALLGSFLSSPSGAASRSWRSASAGIPPSSEAESSRGLPPSSEAQSSRALPPDAKSTRGGERRDVMPALRSKTRRSTSSPSAVSKTLPLHTVRDRALFHKKRCVFGGWANATVGGGQELRALVSEFRHYLRRRHGRRVFRAWNAHCSRQTKNRQLAVDFRVDCFTQHVQSILRRWKRLSCARLRAQRNLTTLIASRRQQIRREIFSLWETHYEQRLWHAEIVACGKLRELFKVLRAWRRQAGRDKRNRAVLAFALSTKRQNLRIQLIEKWRKRVLLIQKGEAVHAAWRGRTAAEMVGVWWRETKLAHTLRRFGHRWEEARVAAVFASWSELTAEKHLLMQRLSERKRRFCGDVMGGWRSVVRGTKTLRRQAFRGWQGFACAELERTERLDRLWVAHAGGKLQRIQKLAWQGWKIVWFEVGAPPPALSVSCSTTPTVRAGAHQHCWSFSQRTISPTSCSDFSPNVRPRRHMLQHRALVKAKYFGAWKSVFLAKNQIADKFFFGLVLRRWRRRRPIKRRVMLGFYLNFVAERAARREKSALLVAWRMGAAVFREERMMFAAREDRREFATRFSSVPIEEGVVHELHSSSLIGQGGGPPVPGYPTVDHSIPFPTTANNSRGSHQPRFGALRSSIVFEPFRSMESMRGHSVQSLCQNSSLQLQEPLQQGLLQDHFIPEDEVVLEESSSFNDISPVVRLVNRGNERIAGMNHPSNYRYQHGGMQNQMVYGYDYGALVGTTTSEFRPHTRGDRGEPAFSAHQLLQPSSHGGYYAQRRDGSAYNANFPSSGPAHDTVGSSDHPSVRLRYAFDTHPIRSSSSIHIPPAAVPADSCDPPSGDESCRSLVSNAEFRRRADLFFFSGQLLPLRKLAFRGWANFAKQQGEKLEEFMMRKQEAASERRRKVSISSYHPVVRGYCTEYQIPYTRRHI